MIKIELQNYTLYYDSLHGNFTLQLIEDEKGEAVVMQISLSGSGIEKSTDSMSAALIGDSFTGSMVRIKDTNILVPYYLFYDTSED